MTKIFCTGNVKRKTVAYGLTELFPDTFSASLATGWDFTDNSIIEKFCETILKYDIFVNSAYVNSSVQIQLMDIVFREWMRENIRGHIINIGTTLENTEDQSEYAYSKRSLRQESMKLSDETGFTGVKTTYLVLGGIANGDPENADYVKPEEIAKAIEWVIYQKCRIPLIQLDGQKC